MQDLINESIKMYGIDVYYLPRKYITQKTVIKEVTESEFDAAYSIEAYLENFEGYSENPTILSKFGIQALNEVTLSLSVERFKNYISPLIKNQPNVRLSSRPKEGDLIFFPLGKRLFEIKYVEHEKPFYQLLNSYTYQLRCELFRYEDEIIDTGIPEIDDLIGVDDGGDDGGDGGGPDDPTNPVGNFISLTMSGIGSTALATATVVNGGVRFITVTNRGGGYTSTPTVGLSSSPSSGGTASAVAEMIGGIVVCNENVNPNSKSVQRVLVVNSGFGYTSAPGVRFVGGGGKGANAVATIGNGIVGRVSVSSSGSGYITQPLVTFTGISSVPASAVAVVSETGSISSILLTNAGLGYTVPPIVTIGNPLLTSSGNFIFNETVTGTQSGVTAKVKSWNSITKVLQVSNVTGQFIRGENIVGSASSASHYLKSASITLSRDGFNANDEIQEEADEIIDFSEINPFGTP